MEAKIYRDLPMFPDKLIGRIDETGDIYDLQSEEALIGWIDYDRGEVYDADDELLGWVEDNGTIFGHYEDDDEEIGYVTEDGEVYGYDEDGKDLYLGKVTDMEDASEGAAAMLMFYDIEEQP